MLGLRSQTEKSLRRLKGWVLLFFLLFSLPMASLLFILMRSAQKEEANVQRAEAVKAYSKIQERAQLLFSKENQRRFEDYSFFNVSQNTLLKQQAGISFSNLSTPTSEGSFPGALGYFQYNPDGSFQTPLLPEIERMPKAEASELLGDEEYRKRIELSEALKGKTQSLSSLLRGIPRNNSPATSTQQLVNIPSQQLRPYVKRQVMPQMQQQLSNSLNTLNLDNDQVRSFETDIAVLELFRLPSGDLAFIRRAFLQGRTYLQGFAIPEEELLKEVIRAPMNGAELKRNLTLEVGGDAGVKADIKTDSSSLREATQVIVFERKLPAPLDGLTLTFRAPSSGLGPSGSFLVMLGSLLGAVFSLAMFVFYRLGKGQIVLAQERGNFVSAVSHELKTPLTSIRMYAEMLSSGMVKEAEKSNEYYRFILSETERLSRLVNNVLLLAQIESRKDALPLSSRSPLALAELASAKIRPLLAESGFSFKASFDSSSEELPEVLVNEDAFLQIILNFVENSTKFSQQTQRKEIEFGVRLIREGVEFFVRDFGPGVPKSELKRIFQLFYRGENELTRSTKGTGLGLGLSLALANRMKGNALARSMAPGLECVLMLRFADAKLHQSTRSVRDRI